MLILCIEIFLKLVAVMTSLLNGIQPFYMTCNGCVYLLHSVVIVVYS